MFLFAYSAEVVTCCLGSFHPSDAVTRFSNFVFLLFLLFTEFIDWKRISIPWKITKRTGSNSLLRKVLKGWKVEDGGIKQWMGKIYFNFINQRNCVSIV